MIDSESKRPSAIRRFASFFSFPAFLLACLLSLVSPQVTSHEVQLVFMGYALLFWVYVIFADRNQTRRRIAFTIVMIFGIFGWFLAIKNYREWPGIIRGLISESRR